MKNNEWQNISDDIDLIKEDIGQDNEQDIGQYDKEKDAEYSWDEI